MSAKFILRFISVFIVSILAWFVFAPKIIDAANTKVTQSPPPTVQVKNTDSTDITGLVSIDVQPGYLTQDGVEADLQELGYELISLRARGISVQAHSGPIPKRCGSDGTTYSTSQGLAVRNVPYELCDDGQSPLFDEYFAQGYSCSVIYNQLSPKHLAILAHEIGHCFYHEYGQYGEFDTAYKKLRGAENISQPGVRELIADDFMICQHQIDTAWEGTANYYIRYSVNPPTPEICASYNQLVDQYLL